LLCAKECTLTIYIVKMSTIIFNAEALVAGELISDELTDVGDLVLDVELSAAQTQGLSLDFVLKGVEGANTIYKPITGEYGQAMTFSLSGQGSIRVPLVGVNCESVKLYLNVPTGATGTITVESTQSANTNTV
jgi:hypothetical protein